MSEKRLGFIKKALLTGAAGVAVLGAAEAKPVSADTPTTTATATVTRTVTPTSTPNENQKMATIQAAIDEELLRQKRLNLEKTATAIAGTKTPIIPSATPDVRATAAAAEVMRMDALGRRQAEIKGTATREAELTVEAGAPKVSPTTTPASKVAAGGETEKNQGGGLLGNILWALGGAAVVLGIVYRDRIAPTVVAVRARFAPPPPPGP